MKQFFSKNYLYVINLSFLIIIIKLILDITLLHWFSSILWIYKMLLGLNILCFVFFNIRSIPFLKHTKMATCYSDEILKNIITSLLKRDSFMIYFLFGLSILLSSTLYNGSLAYFLGIFGLLLTLYFGLKSFKENSK